MGEGDNTEYVHLEIGASDDIEEVVLAYRMDGQLHELIGIRPPLEAKIEQT